VIEPGNRIRVIDRRAAARVRRVAAAAAAAAVAAAAVAAAAALLLDRERDRSIDYAEARSLERELQAI